MKVNIYYGGRGLIDDPTIYVMNKITEVLDELHVNVSRYNLYEDKNGIATLPKTLKDADGIILAASVEWMGIGGLLTQFLDSCWLYADKEKIRTTYMMPVVMASTYGERDAQFTLYKAWEMLGGIPCEGLCSYVEDHVDFETNTDYRLLIEKQSEMFYRAMNKKAVAFPNSSNVVNKSVLRSNTIELTPQESEQLSAYVSNDTFVKKQKEDIEELTQIFKGMLGESKADTKYIDKIMQSFLPKNAIDGIFKIEITDMEQTLVIDVSGDKIHCHYGNVPKADINAKTKAYVMDEILSGKKTFQNAFMSGEMTAQGNFKILRSFDAMFRF